MRFALRFILPLLLVIAVIALGLSPLVNTLMNTWWMRDLDIRARLVGTTIEGSLSEILVGGENTAVQRKAHAFMKKVTQDERLLALGYCNPKGELKFHTELFPSTITCESVKALPANEGTIVELPNGSVYVTNHPAVIEDALESNLVVIHDMSFISRRSDATQKYLFYFFVGTGVLISLVTFGVARWSERGWVRSMRNLLRLHSHGELEQSVSKDRTFLPIAKDLRNLIKDLEATRAARDESQLTWTAKSLKEILARELRGEEVIVVSNRQPYIHVKKAGNIEVQFPASGLVTAVEPILRACSGTWVAHGNGSADKDVVDKLSRVRVPPDKPRYEIQRVWLSKEEEEGYYYGFSNEGLWPLCHIAHTRPVFRKKDWDQYERVNRKFADAVIASAKSDDPVILVQDYHFALLPRMIHETLPKATVITFWHIPWPNAETFGICPWREEILHGLLGSSILGFHTQFHCNNFFDTVDRYLECRIDRESHSVTHSSKLTAIKSYPISIEWPPRWLSSVADANACAEVVRKRHDIASDVRIGIGVDRLDYTKGIIERFSAVERLFELFPEWVGKFTFIQIAAPSRTSISRYQDFDGEVRAAASRINARFGSENYVPILLLVEHHEPEKVFEYFRASHVCFVSSLHDGMNLVAKEFVASRDDEQGVLVLSMFTGASRELVEALIVNPYNFEQCASALNEALVMSPSEQRDRMRSMRGYIREFNVFRWAGRMLLDAAGVRARNRFYRRTS